jgi:hypothetical protein
VGQPGDFEGFADLVGLADLDGAGDFAGLGDASGLADGAAVVLTGTLVCVRSGDRRRSATDTRSDNASDWRALSFAGECPERTGPQVMRMLTPASAIGASPLPGS